MTMAFQATRSGTSRPAPLAMSDSDALVKRLLPKQSLYGSVWRPFFAREAMVSRLLDLQGALRQLNQVISAFRDTTPDTPMPWA